MLSRLSSAVFLQREVMIYEHIRIFLALFSYSETMSRLPLDVCVGERECGVCVRESVFVRVREYYRVAKTHRIPYLYRSFSAKVTYI